MRMKPRLCASRVVMGGSRGTMEDEFQLHIGTFESVLEMRA